MHDAVHSYFLMQVTWLKPTAKLNMITSTYFRVWYVRSRWLACVSQLKREWEREGGEKRKCSLCATLEKSIRFHLQSSSPAWQCPTTQWLSPLALSGLLEQMTTFTWPWWDLRDAVRGPFWINPSIMTLREER